MLRYVLVVVALGGLVGCSQPSPRFDAPRQIPDEKRVSTKYARIEVANVSLPAYAQSEEIHVRDASGAILPLGPLWTDAPDRTMTQAFSVRLAGLTGKLVAPEPWPFREFADVRIDLRLDTFLATHRGTFIIEGQAFVAPEVEEGRDRVLPFAIEAEPSGPEGPLGIAEARDIAVAQLAEFVAINGLR